MGFVRRLPDDLANQIAAGEVVERPASVVKELLENAIDAGATRVRVDIEAGGVGLVRVSDDGAGMSAEDATLAVERHATSKIARLDDLTHIGTYGFRGEALPSIASVSRLTLTTRLAADDAGTLVTVEGGGPAVVRPTGSPPGTTVEVRDLFFNVPARRKFLRQTATESAHVTDVVEAAALAAPGLTVQLARDGRIVREWLRAGSREERARAALKDEPLTPCRGERGPLSVEAFLSRPERARAGATSLTLLVNDRVVRDRAVLRAAAQAYGSVLESGRYPVGVLYVDLPRDRVDVNVHPQKAEVRFADGRAVADAVFRVLADALSGAFGLPPAQRWHGAQARPTAITKESVRRALDDPRPSADGDPWGLGSVVTPASGVAAPEPATPSPLTIAGASADAPASFARGGASSPAPPLPYARVEPAPRAAEGGGPRFANLTFVAQVRQTFLVCEGPDGLYVLDQHAAAERVAFHRLRRAYAGRDVATQTLLFPISVEVTAADAALVEEEQDAFQRVGLDVRIAGPTRVSVHAVPKLLTRATPETLVRDLLAEASRSGGRAFSDAVDLVLATMACHGSVRAGDKLTREEATALLGALDDVDFAGHCPHGRPIVTRMGWEELERKVGRR